WGRMAQRGRPAERRPGRALGLGSRTGRRRRFLRQPRAALRTVCPGDAPTRGPETRASEGRSQPRPRCDGLRLGREDEPSAWAPPSTRLSWLVISAGAKFWARSSPRSRTLKRDGLDGAGAVNAR